MEDIATVIGEFQKLTAGKVDDVKWNKMKPFYANMSKDLDIQRKRIGGDFVIAQAIATRELRDHCRTILPDCVFITMTLTKENQLKRVKARHGDDCDKMLECFNQIVEAYEKPGEGERNTYNLDIDENMSQNDVMEKVLGILEKHYN